MEKETADTALFLTRYFFCIMSIVNCDILVLVKSFFEINYKCIPEQVCMHCCGGRLGLPRSILHFLEIKSFPKIIAVTKIIRPQTENIKFRLVIRHMCKKILTFRLVIKHMCKNINIQAGYKTHV